ncbi:E3 ubiquitin ligase family protein [Geminocystis herdmanii]|uniref:E3 ubiquitin ligase family protein n=1 Tax=Geminocystis herdmanii TaxID=669359 RepID=UPI00034DE7E7|nr:E3 ubiquitin ligase family protein [Geminocystis herdmanii]
MLLGIILIIIGIVLFIIRQIQAKELLSLQSARQTNIEELISTANSISQEIGGGDWRDYVKIWGKITVNKPILSELKQEPCVYYKMKVQREYEEKEITSDSKGNRQERMVKKTETISENVRSIPFFLEDKTGRIIVNPEEGKIDTIKILDEFRNESSEGGMLQFGNFSLMLNNNFLNSSRRIFGYRYKESILPIDREILVIGQVSDETGDLRIHKPSNNQEKFMISLKTNEALIHSYGQNQQNLFYGFISCIVIGIVIIFISM